MNILSGLYIIKLGTDSFGHCGTDSGGIKKMGSIDCFKWFHFFNFWKILSQLNWLLWNKNWTRAASRASNFLPNSRRVQNLQIQPRIIDPSDFQSMEWAESMLDDDCDCEFLRGDLSAFLEQIGLDVQGRFSINHWTWNAPYEPRHCPCILLENAVLHHNLECSLAQCSLDCTTESKDSCTTTSVSASAGQEGKSLSHVPLLIFV